MLNFNSFNALDVRRQTEYVWDNGMYISSKIKEDCVVNLHQLHNFYVELLYCKKANKVKQIMAFKKVDAVLEYLDEPELNMHVEAVNDILQQPNF